uniref:Tyrosine specific protein phosphatases domain-containing protein n=1 Tax=viral metagenome TaxID=1070528 RepID=A0A6M3LRC1_9ZZZZ
MIEGTSLCNGIEPERKVFKPITQTFVPLRVCEHIKQPVKIGSNIIYATSYTDLAYSKNDDAWDKYRLPDLLIALTQSWLGKTGNIFTCGFKGRAPAFDSPTIYVDWSDGSALNLVDTEWLVRTALNHMRRNEKVEVSCMGAHGRTGTLIACILGVEEHLPPKEAIQELRSRYCKKAIETMKQIRQVYTFLGSTEEEANKDWEIKPIDITTYAPWISKYLNKHKIGIDKDNKSAGKLIGGVPLPEYYYDY